MLNDMYINSAVLQRPCTRWILYLSKITSVEAVGHIYPGDGLTVNISYGCLKDFLSSDIFPHK